MKKRKLSRILGIALTIALLTSMIMMATPASAAEGDEVTLTAPEVLVDEPVLKTGMLSRIISFSEVTPVIIPDGGAYLLTEVQVTNEVTSTTSKNQTAGTYNLLMAVLSIVIIGLAYITFITRKTKTEGDWFPRFIINWRGTDRHPLKFPASA